MKNNKKNNKKNSKKKTIVIIGTLIVVIAVVIAIIILCKPRAIDDRSVVNMYIENPDKEYTDDEKKEIVLAYKAMLEEQGEDYVDSLFTREEQMQITFLGMQVNEYVFRDFKNVAYLNADNSFMDVNDFSYIAGFDVDGVADATGFINLKEVDITIDGTHYTTADLTNEMQGFFERLRMANVTENVNTIMGVDQVDVDDNTRLYITYMDVQYDDSENVTSLRVSGHLCLKEMP